jgi:hypothetical protein
MLVGLSDQGTNMTTCVIKTTNSASQVIQLSNTMDVDKLILHGMRIQYVKVVEEGMGTCLVFLCRLLRIPGPHSQGTSKVSRLSGNIMLEVICTF